MATTFQKRAVTMVDSLEIIPCSIFSDPKEGARFVAQKIAAIIRQKQEAGEMCVLGLATGSTPKSLYAELVRMHRQEALSFRNVISFNLDEYYPITAEAAQSYHRYMNTLLFQHIDMDPKNIHIPDGSLPKEKLKQHCADYEKKIEEAGGVDLQVLGIGNNGHIGFNEPGSSIYSRTRLISLENSTRLANAHDFANISQVPRLALTMGIQTILKAKHVILMAWGAAKAPVIQKAVEGFLTEQVPASLLQQHNHCEFVVDEQAASELTRFKSPWLTGEIEWSPAMIKKAVVNMALAISKPILSLTSADYNEYGLGDLLVEKGNPYDINLQVYYMLRDTITGWPGGKPGVVLPTHPERSEPYPKRVLIFSPHPDDDIISMGGTFQRLHDQGHEVHVAYQTSGNIAVTDEFVTRFLDFALGFEAIAGSSNDNAHRIAADIRSYLSVKNTELDTPQIRAIKGLIRRCEAKATCRSVGIGDDHAHFLDLPFYETGTIEKKPLGEEDIRLTMELLNQIRPHQIFCAGDLADPHGTHKVCLDIVFESLHRLKQQGGWIDECWMWLYKGAWQEWKIEEIEMAIPMSPEQVQRKRYGIFIHQSQKDMVPFQGSDAREFWQRAEERNATTANLYAQLGLTHYAAIEAFVRWHY